MGDSSHNFTDFFKPSHSRDTHREDFSQRWKNKYLTIDLIQDSLQYRFTQICGYCTVSKVGEHARPSFTALIRKLLSWLLKQMLRGNAQLWETQWDTDGVAGCKTEQDTQSTCVLDYILTRGRKAEPGPCSWPAVRRGGVLTRKRLSIHFLLGLSPQFLCGPLPGVVGSVLFLEWMNCLFGIIIWA